jgi:hypothetical protein
MRALLLPLCAAALLALASCSGAPQSGDPDIVMTCKVEGQVCGQGTGCCGDLVCGKSGNYGTKVCRAP